MTEIDYLIVGQGIAGSALGWILSQRGHKILIVDDTTQHSSTKVSAGIFNPLTGKKINLTWKADEIFPFAQNFYADIETKLNINIVNHCNIYRPFRNIEEQNTYLSRTAEPQLTQYINDTPKHEDYGKNIQNSFGGLEVTQSGWIDTSTLLNYLKRYFVEKNQYLEDVFCVQNVDNQGYEISCKNFKVKKVIFCEGHKLSDNSFFGWLPFAPVKGEILTAHIEDYSQTNIVNQGVWILPLNNSGHCRIGSTYEWDQLDNQTTITARQEIEEKVNIFLKNRYTIVGHQAGIRPATVDRRPLIGCHPEFSQLLVFNGLGTKGITLAPFFANQLADFLVNNKEIDSNVNIERYYSLYYSIK